MILIRIIFLSIIKYSVSIDMKLETFNTLITNWSLIQVIKLVSFIYRDISIINPKILVKILLIENKLFFAPIKQLKLKNIKNIL